MPEHRRIGRRGPPDIGDGLAVSQLNGVERPPLALGTAGPRADPYEHPLQVRGKHPVHLEVEADGVHEPLNLSPDPPLVRCTTGLSGGVRTHEYR
jgi:hypothetical protein